MRSKHTPTLGMSYQERANYYIQKSKERFGDAFDYSLIAEIKLKKSPVQIICKKHGILETSFEHHLASGTGCFHCGDERCRNKKRMTFEVFLRRIDEVNPNKTYKIISREFVGRRIKHEKVYTQDEFGICKVDVCGLMKGENPTVKAALFPELYSINRYRKIHGFWFDFNKTNYTGALKYTTVNCRKHGEFKTKPNWLLSGMGCGQCFEDSRSQKMVSNTRAFIRKAIERWGHNRKIYDRVDYTGAKNKVLILCEKHNEYYPVTPNDHLTGYGCPICGLETGGYGREDFIRAAKGRESLMHLISCFDGKEVFFKIGITSLNVGKRFNTTLSLPYDYEIIYEYKGEAGHIWDIEREHHNFYFPYRYKPTKNFAGQTECYSISLPVQEIVDKLA